ncbi:MAG: class I SAM-dependent methyltransferase [Nanoarchaeota archaeon]
MKKIKNQAFLWNTEYKSHKTLWHLESENLSSKIKGKRVLELGVGDGKTLRSILKKNPMEVIAIDFSSEAIKKCKNQFNENIAHFKKADITKIQFEDNKFDAIFCYYVLNNMLEKDRILAVNEIYRVLRKKGIVFFEDFSIGDFREEKKAKRIESHTIKKKYGIICHFFKTNELNTLFSKFSTKKFKLKVTKPITHKGYLKRKIISGIIVK